MTEQFGAVPLPLPSGESLLQVWYDPSSVPGQPRQPQAQQVVAFDAIPNDECINGAVLDVNQHFIVYAVKVGMIRVLHRQSPLRSLLRGHTKNITDLAFFQNGDVLGSVGGNLIVWRIFERAPEIQSEKLLEIPDSLSYISRLMWHPFNPNQFWLMHQNAQQLQVATLVETTHITTTPHETEQHALCRLHSSHVVMDGAVQLVVPNADLTDLAWSGRDTKHVLTTYTDGTIRLWDCKQVTQQQGDIAHEDGIITAQCLVSLHEDHAVTRCLFLPHDNVLSQVASLLHVPQEQQQQHPAWSTCAFLTASHGNSRITIWSAFTEDAQPTKLQVFGIEHPSSSLSYNVGLCFGPPSGPHGGQQSPPPPSCFVLLSDRQQGQVYAVHLKSAWSATSSTAATMNNTPASAQVPQAKPLAVGMDYVVPFTTNHHAIYSWSIFAAPAEHLTEDEEPTGLQFDVKFYAYQSKMVQQYTLPHYMCLPPSSSPRLAGGAPGIRVVESAAPVSAVVPTAPQYDEDYELDEEEDGVDDEEEEEEQEFQQAPDPSSLPTPEGLRGPSDDDKEKGVGDSNPFANWLGAIASKTGVASGTQAPPTTPASATANIVPPEIANVVSLPEVVEPPPPPRPSSVPVTRTASGSFLSPMELMSERSSDLGFAAESLPMPSKANTKPPADTKKKKRQTKETATTKAEASSKPNGEKKKSQPGSIAILKREDAAAPMVPSSVNAVDASPKSRSEESAMEALLEKMLSTHFKKQESLIISEVQRAVRSEIQTSVVPALSKSLSQTMEQTVVKPLNSMIKKASMDSVKTQKDAVVLAVSKSVEGPLRDAFSEGMKTVLIPAYEAATREMFEQISVGLDKGLSSSAATQSGSDALSAKMDSMAKAIESLSSEVMQLRVMVGAQGGSASSKGAASADTFEMARNEILGLLRQRNYEAAFTKALSTSSAEMAVFCCKNSSLSDVLGGNTPALSQPILLCLMQQLGAVLVSSTVSDLEMEVAWLQEIALTLDPGNESIKRHVPGVLQQLVESINERMAEGDPALRRPLQMLLQVIRGMQR